MKPPINTPHSHPGRASAPNAAAGPQSRPTQAGIPGTRHLRTLSKRLLFGLTRRGLESAPSYYTRPHPRFQPQPAESAAESIHCIWMNAASCLCWPMLRAFAPLRRALCLPQPEAAHAWSVQKAPCRQTDKAPQVPALPLGTSSKPAAATDKPSSWPQPTEPSLEDKQRLQTRRLQEAALLSGLNKPE